VVHETCRLRGGREGRADEALPPGSIHGVTRVAATPLQCGHEKTIVVTAFGLRCRANARYVPPGQDRFWIVISTARARVFEHERGTAALIGDPSIA
jgi:hypothetical protein